MPTNETYNQDGAKTKFKSYKRALERLSIVLPYSILKMISDDPSKIRRVPMTILLHMRNAEVFASITRLSGGSLGCLWGKKHD